MSATLLPPGPLQVQPPLSDSATPHQPCACAADQPWACYTSVQRECSSRAGHSCSAPVELHVLTWSPVPADESSAQMTSQGQTQTSSTAALNKATLLVSDRLEIISPHDVSLVKFLGSGGYGEVSICVCVHCVHCMRMFCLRHTCPRFLLEWLGGRQHQWNTQALCLRHTLLWMSSPAPARAGVPGQVAQQRGRHQVPQRQPLLSRRRRLTGESCSPQLQTPPAVSCSAIPAQHLVLDVGLLQAMPSRLLPESKLG